MDDRQSADQAPEHLHHPEQILDLARRPYQILRELVRRRIENGGPPEQTPSWLMGPMADLPRPKVTIVRSSGPTGRP